MAGCAASSASAAGRHGGCRPNAAGMERAERAEAERFHPYLYLPSEHDALPCLPCPAWRADDRCRRIPRRLALYLVPDVPVSPVFPPRPSLVHGMGMARHGEAQHAARGARCIGAGKASTHPPIA